MNKCRLILFIVVLLTLTFARPQTVNGQATRDPTPQKFLRYSPNFHFFSPTEGWVWADRLYWTNDAGQTWIDIMPPLGPSNDAFNGIETIDFINNRLGTVITGTRDPVTFYVNYMLFRTVDSGKTWISQPTNIAKQLGDRPPGLTLQMLNAQIGWLTETFTIQSAPVGMLYKTEDGGATWMALNLPDNKPLFGFIGEPGYFVTEQLGWVVSEDYSGGNFLYRT